MLMPFEALAAPAGSRRVVQVMPSGDEASSILPIGLPLPAKNRRPFQARLSHAVVFGIQSPTMS